MLDENPGLEDALKDSMQSPIKILANQFKAMKIKDQLLLRLQQVKIKSKIL